MRGLGCCIDYYLLRLLISQKSPACRHLLPTRFLPQLRQTYFFQTSALFSCMQLCLPISCVHSTLRIASVIISRKTCTPWRCKLTREFLSWLRQCCLPLLSRSVRLHLSLWTQQWRLARVGWTSHHLFQPSSCISRYRRHWRSCSREMSRVETSVTCSSTLSMALSSR